MSLKKKVILLDIEGTTTSISFVKDELFPFVKNNLELYLEKNWNTDQLKLDIQLLKEQAEEDVRNNVPGVVAYDDSSDTTLKKFVVSNVLWQMSLDRKTKALKTLQGHIWIQGYEEGVLKGHIYEDVCPCLEKWKQAGFKLYIYSSGSVEAQKLLFGHTSYGDLLHYFSGYFDTNVGLKTDSSSYQNILRQIDCDPQQVLFLTDMLKEAEAAKEAGIATILLARDLPVDSKDFNQVRSFNDINIEFDVS